MKTGGRRLTGDHLPGPGSPRRSGVALRGSRKKRAGGRLTRSPAPKTCQCSHRAHPFTPSSGAADNEQGNGKPTSRARARTIKPERVGQQGRSGADMSRNTSWFAADAYGPHILPPQLLPGAVILSGRCVNAVPHCSEGPLKALTLLCRWSSCAAAGTPIE